MKTILLRPLNKTTPLIAHNLRRHTIFYNQRASFNFSSINTSEFSFLLHPKLASCIFTTLLDQYFSSLSTTFNYLRGHYNTHNMKLLDIFFVLAIIMALAISLTATPSEEEESSLDFSENEDDENFDLPWLESQETTSSLRGANRFLAQKIRAVMTCDKYPRACRAKGSPGPDCCKKKCVNVMTDRLNCGMCGKKCKYPEICCKGQCVNPMSNKKNCGGCSNKCKKGSKCQYGMCSYA
jgi:hypothetical protein